jgi:hypothetical protein
MGCRRSSCGSSRLRNGNHGEGVNDGNVCNGDPLWQGREDVAPSLWANGGAVGRSACAGSEAADSLEGWLKGGGDARTVHSTAQNPCQDVMAQRNLCSEGVASHALVGV